MPKFSSIILFLLVALTGCSTVGYYSQAIGGHIEVMRAARPISEVIDDPDCDPALKKKLEEVRQIRDFASRELALPDNDSYRSYADLQRPFVTWNVFAAPEFSLQPESWCMPIVGCVGYRGFYSKDDAESFAGELRQQGFDTYVGGIPAYSTLGYFSDPVLNTFLRSGSYEVARLIFHELAHQVLYAEGDTVFNESFATAIENEGLRRWFSHTAHHDLAKSVGRYQQRKASFVELVRSYRGRLQEIYVSDASVEIKRQAKAEVMDKIRHDYLSRSVADGSAPYYKQWLETDLNNAKIASLAIYTRLLPTFEALLAADDHDLPRFYRRMAILAAMPYGERKATLEELQPAERPVVTRLEVPE